MCTLAAGSGCGEAQGPARARERKAAVDDARPVSAAPGRDEHDRGSSAARAEEVSSSSERCPAGMVYVAGGTLLGDPVAARCFDVTEVTVKDYSVCVTRGRCA